MADSLQYHTVHLVVTGHLLNNTIIKDAMYSNQGNYYVIVKILKIRFSAIQIVFAAIDGQAEYIFI